MKDRLLTAFNVNFLRNYLAFNVCQASETQPLPGAGGGRKRVEAGKPLPCTGRIRGGVGSFLLFRVLFTLLHAGRPLPPLWMKSARVPGSGFWLSKGNKAAETLGHFKSWSPIRN